jgi:hypothetical protein
VAERVGGTLERLTLEQLTPDWQNPRFLPGTVERFDTDEDVYEYLDRKYNAHAVADSIARHGYFDSEPLIAIPRDGDGQFIVVEGNRRLAALKALADPDLRRRMRRRGWADLPEDVELPEDLPVLVVDSRERVAPILGFRHITGIAPWDPYQQARYVAEMIDGEQLSAEDVAERIGRDVGEVRAFYRNFSIVEQAEDVFEIDDTKRAVDEFGVWSRAMTSLGIRSYIGAPPPRGVVEREYPLEEDSRERLERLFVWLFGVPRSDKDRAEGKQSREGRAIPESRYLNRLGKAMLHPRGLAALEAGEDLERAERAMLDIRARFTASLEEAKEALESARAQRPKPLSKGSRDALEEIGDIVEELKRDS